MLKKKKKFLSDECENDPTSGLTNLFDAMLVLAVGFLIFSFMALSANPNIISENTKGPTPNTVSVSMGETMEDNLTKESGSDSNYTEMGKVYKDPETDKLIMVT